VRRQKGYSLIEMLAAMAIFSIFFFVLIGLQREFIRFDHDMRLRMFSHPAPLSVLARLQRDILDSTSYPTDYQTWSQSATTLLLTVPGKDGSVVVVWDFDTPSAAKRLAFPSGGQVEEWNALAVPQYEIGSFEMPDGRIAVRVQSYDEQGRLAIDRIILPRAD